MGFPSKPSFDNNSANAMPPNAVPEWRRKSRRLSSELPAGDKFSEFMDV
jgi:hypothetical protein